MAFAAALTEKRGPRVGDAASLWNFTPAPGWTREEVQILRLCLMKHGVGQWLQILGTGLLPGKLIQQLNGQTQRLLGQQSLAAFTGLRVDVDRVRADNEARTDATRKAGLIIYDGPTLTKEMKAELRDEAQRKYGLTAEQLQKVDEQLEELMRFTAAASGGAGMDAAVAAVGGSGLGGGALTSAQAHAQAMAKLDPELGRLLAIPTDQLSSEQLVQLLKRLRNRLACLVDRYRERSSMTTRSGPRWHGEQDAAALLDAAAGYQTAGAVAAAAYCGAVGCSRAAQGEGLAAVVVGGRQLLTEATACRVRSGTTAVPPRPPASGSGAAAGGSRKRSKPSRTRGGGGGGANGDGGDWSGDEENTGPSAAEGGKRRTEAARRGTRAKRPPRYDKYVDDAVYDEVDPDIGMAETMVDPSAALDTLTAMGFTPRKARGALRECHFNVEAAVEWLFANCV